ncbi:hypothetical protein SynWH8101_1027 [Synechococcus sp. WH 8101]|nr:hypothetical protein SynWH8101_1027 [Synechococcus sp. WH 8101]
MGSDLALLCGPAGLSFPPVLMNPMTHLHRCCQGDKAAALEEPVQLTLTLQPAVLDQVEQLRLEWGLNSRAAVVERLLVEVLMPMV